MGFIRVGRITIDKIRADETRGILLRSKRYNDLCKTFDPSKQATCPAMDIEHITHEEHDELRVWACGDEIIEMPHILFEYVERVRK